MVIRLLAGPTVCVRSLGPIWWREWSDSLQVLLSFPPVSGVRERTKTLWTSSITEDNKIPKQQRRGWWHTPIISAFRKHVGKEVSSDTNLVSKAILVTYPDNASVNPAWGGGRASLEKGNASKSFTELIHTENKIQKVSAEMAQQKKIPATKLNDPSSIPGTDTVDVEN